MVLIFLPHALGRLTRSEPIQKVNSYGSLGTNR